MKYKVKLHKKGKIKELEVEEGENLLKCIQENESDFIAPCGGNGTCGKCRVKIKNDGYVTSCMYPVHEDIEVLLPGELEMKVLSSQYELTKTVWPEPNKAFNLAPMPFGLAVDIGTTTMVFYLVNLVTGSVVSVKTAINPQSKFGADVISRISYGELTERGVEMLQSSLIEPINNALDLHYTEQGISKQDLVKISIVGNTTMLHNLLGVNALPIAHAPFVPVFTDVKRLKADELGINIHPDGEIVLSPSLSAYVGADILSGLNSLDTQKLGKTYLFVDIGTNGEMVLVNDEKILSCATAAGPAFEGANISCGMSAVKGAISKYSNEMYEVIGNTDPVGICGSGLIDIIAVMLKKGVLQQDGNINEDFVISQAGDNKSVGITQQDIREIQLAKSAIMSGIKRLLAIAQISEENLDHVILAGGFGNYINIKNAIRIGLLPDIDINKYLQVGNTAGTGAVLALKSERYLSETEELKSKMEYIELSTDDDFTMEFAMNMYF
ncbi:MAG: ASKHA domain-containing protein [Bacteroidota bacterium]